MPDTLTSFIIAIGVMFAFVAFLNALLSPMIAAFAAGLGVGALGVLAVLRAIPQRGRP